MRTTTTASAPRQGLSRHPSLAPPAAALGRGGAGLSRVCPQGRCAPLTARRRPDALGLTGGRPAPTGRGGAERRRAGLPGSLIWRAHLRPAVDMRTGPRQDRGCQKNPNVYGQLPADRGRRAAWRPCPCPILAHLCRPLDPARPLGGPFRIKINRAKIASPLRGPLRTLRTTLPVQVRGLILGNSAGSLGRPSGRSPASTGCALAGAGRSGRTGQSTCAPTGPRSVTQG